MASRIARVRVRDRVKVRVRIRFRVRISYSQASRVYQPRMAIHTVTSEASHMYSISCFKVWLPYEDVDFR